MTLAKEFELTENELQQFFSGLADRMEIAADYERQINRFKAPLFNLFNSSYIGPDENKITSILADLLDPSGSHGQGSMFIESFLHLVGFERAVNSGLGKALVRTQHTTTRGRYIDLTARNGKCIFGLENKIDAGEEEDQMADYIEYLSSNPNDDWFIIFLTLDRRDPKTRKPGEWDDLRKQQKGRSLSYAELATWLICCASRCKSDRVCGLLQDMAEWAKKRRKKPVGIDSAQKLVSDFIIKNPQHFKTSLAVVDACGAVKKKMIIEFAESLKKALLERVKGEWSSEESKTKFSESDIDRKYAGIFIRDNSWQNDCTIGIEAQDPNMQSLGFGIAADQLAPELRQRIKDQLNARFGKSLKSDSFVWYRRVPDFRGIDVSCWWDTPTLLAMHDERRPEIIDHFVDRIKSIADIVGPILGKDSGQNEVA